MCYMLKNKKNYLLSKVLPSGKKNKKIDRVL